MGGNIVYIGSVIEGVVPVPFRKISVFLFIYFLNC